MTQQDDITQRVLTAEQEAVRRALEAYAESYDMMARVAKREGRDASVGVHAVAYDIRRNMVNAVLRALSKLRAPVADERAAKLDAECNSLAHQLNASNERNGVLRAVLSDCSAELFAQCGDQPRAMSYVNAARAAIAQQKGEA